MTIRIFNTLSRKIENFKPINGNEVKMYSCGPTVYDYAHIGNLRYFVFVDLLKRILKEAGYSLYQVMNITDIDDKPIKRANEKGVDFHEISLKYEKIFFEDLGKLKCSRPDLAPRATDEIDFMSEMIQFLIEKGYAYERSGSVYFSLASYPEYGKLSKLDLSKVKIGARVDMDTYEKASPGDFALWKGKKDNEPSYKMPFGEGRPGWHIECSAISRKHLGEQFDIHTGGVDLIFPHHENEKAQSEAFCGVKTVNYWIHSEYLIVEGKKMSKSLGNFYTLRELEDMGFDYDSVRYMLISSHYRAQLNFTITGLKAAESTISNIKMFVQHLMAGGEGTVDLSDMVREQEKAFFDALMDDLGIGNALSHLFIIINNINSADPLKVNAATKEAVIEAFTRFNTILDISQLEMTESKIPADVNTLAQERHQARLDKDYSRADELRGEITEMGYIVEDTPEGFILRKMDE